jgi:hypothetical protein
VIAPNEAAADTTHTFPHALIHELAHRTHYERSIAAYEHIVDALAQANVHKNVAVPQPQ